MKMNKQTYLVALLVVGILLSVIWEFAPLQDASARFNAFPKSGVGFVGEDVPLENWEEQIFGHINLLKRRYQFDSGTYFVTIMDGTNDRHIVHDPQYCFTGGGWTIKSREELPVASGSAVLMKMRKGLLYREAVVWFSNGSSRHSSPIKYFLQTCLRRLTLGKSGPEPVMIMIQPASGRSRNQWPEVLSSDLWTEI